MNEMLTVIEESSDYARYLMFPVEQVKNWRTVANTCNFLAGLKPYCAYEINVLADVDRDSNSNASDVSLNLLKKRSTFSSFESFDCVPVRPLTHTVRE